MKKLSALNRFEQLDQQLENQLKILATQDDQLLFKSPGPGEWSPIQVLQHLLLSERGSLNYLKKKISSGLQAIPPATLLTSVRFLLFRAFLALPIKVKAPKAISEESFPEVDSIDAVADEYHKLRQDFKALLTSLPEEAFSLEIFRHPRAGKITLAGLIQFFELHFKRHEKQIQRALK
ncbi:MAG: DinB family protein [Saprospiraceae bacterium]|jgi:hypothetical protein